MKVYRRSAFKSHTVYLLIFFTVLFALSLKKLVEFWPGDEVGDGGLPFLMAALFLGMLLFAGANCYVVVGKDRLAVRNLFLRFWGGRYRYETIRSVEIRSRSVRGIRYETLQVFMDGRKSKRYTIDLVSPRDYSDMIRDLRAKGVVVRTEELTR